MRRVGRRRPVSDWQKKGKKRSKEEKGRGEGWGKLLSKPINQARNGKECHPTQEKKEEVSTRSDHEPKRKKRKEPPGLLMKSAKARTKEGRSVTVSEENRPRENCGRDGTGIEFSTRKVGEKGRKVTGSAV